MEVLWQQLVLGVLWRKVTLSPVRGPPLVVARMFPVKGPPFAGQFPVKGPPFVETVQQTVARTSLLFLQEQH